MSPPITCCLTCKSQIVDSRTTIAMNGFHDVSKIRHVHEWCFLCVRCNTPLTMDNAVLADDTEELLCFNHHLNKYLPEDCHYCGKGCGTDKIEDQGYFYHQVISNLNCTS